MNQLDQLATYLDKLQHPLQQITLENYLLALYKNLLDNKPYYLTTQPTLSILAHILETSLTSEPALFDKEWLKIITPPEDNRMSHKLTHPTIKDQLDKSPRSTLQGLDFTLAVLEFQIAELHKMQGKQLIDPYRYFGIDSETGHRWYNFDPFANLTCGLARMIAHEQDITSLDWSFLGNLLEDGRIYE